MTANSILYARFSKAVHWSDMCVCGAKISLRAACILRSISLSLLPFMHTQPHKQWMVQWALERKKLQYKYIAIGIDLQNKLSQMTESDKRLTNYYSNRSTSKHKLVDMEARKYQHTP